MKKDSTKSNNSKKAIDDLAVYEELGEGEASAVEESAEGRRKQREDLRGTTMTLALAMTGEILNEM